MNEFAEYYISYETKINFMRSKLLSLAEIWFEITEDILNSVKKWEQLGFIQLKPKNDMTQRLKLDRRNFTTYAASIGASLVIYRPWPSSPEPVYFVPESHDARKQVEISPEYGRATVFMPNMPSSTSEHIGPLVHEAAFLGVLHTNDLSNSVAAWKENGFVVLGTSDVAAKNNDIGLSTRRNAMAIAVGASLVISKITPAKVRAIKRNADGFIDIDAVLADQPANIYPQGNSVEQVVFLAPTSLQALELLESQTKIGINYVQVGSES